MVKQHKNILVYALILIIAAAALIILSAITQNRITAAREEEIKNNLTTDITARLQKNMQQNIDDINDENTKLKAQSAEDKKNIEALEKQIEELNQLAADKTATDERNQTLTSRSQTISREIDRAMNYYKQGYSSSARKTIKNLQSTINEWEAEDKKADEAAAAAASADHTTTESADQTN